MDHEIALLPLTDVVFACCLLLLLFSCLPLTASPFCTRLAEYDTCLRESARADVAMLLWSRRYFERGGEVGKGNREAGAGEGEGEGGAHDHNDAVEASVLKDPCTTASDH